MLRGTTGRLGLAVPCTRGHGGLGVPSPRDDDEPPVADVIMDDDDSFAAGKGASNQLRGDSVSSGRDHALRAFKSIGRMLEEGAWTKSDDGDLKHAKSVAGWPSPVMNDGGLKRVK